MSALPPRLATRDYVLRLEAELVVARADLASQTEMCESYATRWGYACEERDAAQRENERVEASRIEVLAAAEVFLADTTRAESERDELQVENERLGVLVADLKAALEAEVERLDPRHDDLFGGGWLKKAWNDGVRTARAVSHQNLSALLARGDGALDGGSRPPEVDGSEHREPQGEGT